MLVTDSSVTEDRLLLGLRTRARAELRQGQPVTDPTAAPAAKQVWPLVG